MIASAQNHALTHRGCALRRSRLKAGIGFPLLTLLPFGRSERASELIEACRPPLAVSLRGFVRRDAGLGHVISVSPFKVGEKSISIRVPSHTKARRDLNNSRSSQCDDLCSAHDMFRQSYAGFRLARPSKCGSDRRRGRRCARQSLYLRREQAISLSTRVASRPRILRQERWVSRV
jgi:hypothetical protein